MIDSRITNWIHDSRLGSAADREGQRPGRERGAVESLEAIEEFDADRAQRFERLRELDFHGPVRGVVGVLKLRRRAVGRRAKIADANLTRQRPDSSRAKTGRGRRSYAGTSVSSAVGELNTTSTGSSGTGGAAGSSLAVGTSGAARFGERRPFDMTRPRSRATVPVTWTQRPVSTRASTESSTPRARGRNPVTQTEPSAERSTKS